MTLCCTAFILPLLKKTGIFIFKLGNPQKEADKRMTADTNKQLGMIQYLRQILANWCVVAYFTSNTVGFFLLLFCFVKGNQILSSLSIEEYKATLKMIKQAILATDLALYIK